MTTPPAPGITSSDLRRLMPVTAKWAYFDNAAVAPLPDPARQAIHQWAAEAVEEGDTIWEKWVQRIEKTRATAARLINASSDDIALISNTTAGVTIVAEGLDWSPGDNIVTLANEFPTNQYPWINLASRGVETRRVPVADGVTVDLDRIDEAIDEHTRLLTISWVGYATGWRVDLDAVSELARRRGILLFVDAIQGLGVFPLDVQRTPIDFLSADGHKWMLGPEGAGIFYVRRDHLDRLRAIGVGWNSVIQRSDYSRIEFQLRPTAARYEGGSHNMAGFIGLGASLQLLESCGLGPHQSAVADRVLELTRFACDRLTLAGARIASSRAPGRASGIVSFEFPGRDPQELRKKCLSRQVALGCRAGRLRISPHAYANEEDVERLVAALRAP